MEHERLVRKIAGAYVEAIRGTPMLVQAMFLYFGVPMAVGMRIPPLVAGIIVIAVNSGAYIAEIVRGAVQSINVGQMEAGLDTGPVFGTVTVEDTSGAFTADWYADPVNGTDCTVTMVPNDMAVEGSSCSFSFEIGDEEAGCDVAGTVFFEGIPTLSQYGLALMALLMLGVGAGTFLLGVSAAWLTAMCDFPGRRFFSWALLLPMAMPASTLDKSNTTVASHHATTGITKSLITSSTATARAPRSSTTCCGCCGGWTITSSVRVARCPTGGSTTGRPGSVCRRTSDHGRRPAEAPRPRAGRRPAGRRILGFGRCAPRGALGGGRLHDRWAAGAGPCRNEHDMGG